jgi:hypothetical protein
MRISILSVVFYALFTVNFAYAGSHFVRGPVNKKRARTSSHITP